MCNDTVYEKIVLAKWVMTFCRMGHKALCVSEEHVASIFSVVKEEGKQDSSGDCCMLYA
jgi:hypothetical protein